MKGGDGTALTHWEKRIFQNEAMTGTVNTAKPVYSRLVKHGLRLVVMKDNLYSLYSIFYKLSSSGPNVKRKVKTRP